MANTLNIHQRLAAVMETVTYIKKEEKKGMHYSIVSHDAVTAKVRPALLRAGIVYYPVRCEHTHNGNRAECGMTIRFVNIDEPTDFFDVQTFGYGVDPQDKGPGKAMSYAVKYALLKALGLETGDDADHDNIDHSKNDPAQKDPREYADRMIAAVQKAITDEKYNAVVMHDAFKTNLDWIESVKPPMAAEVRAAMNAKAGELARQITNQGAG